MPLKLKELFQIVSEESTCRKRAVVCILISKEGKVVSSGANKCDPPDGICRRLGVTQNRENYDTESACNWNHAEIQALNNLPEGYKPYLAIMKGHGFYCQQCEEALRAAGVTKFEVIE